MRGEGAGHDKEVSAITFVESETPQSLSFECRRASLSDPSLFLGDTVHATHPGARGHFSRCHEARRAREWRGEEDVERAFGKL